jgi:hypothetical protein
MEEAAQRGGIDQSVIHVVLKGGPDDLPINLRTRHEPVHDEKLKIPHRGGYEHFERCPPNTTESMAPIVYYWTTRTHIAE